MADSTLEPIGVESDVLELQDGPVEEVLGGGARPLLGRARERAPRDGWGWPAGLTTLGAAASGRWTALTPRRRRWVKLGAAATAVLALGVALTVSRPTPPAPQHASTPLAVAVPGQPGGGIDSRTTYDPNSDTTSALGTPLSVPGGPVRDVGIASSVLYVVSANAISVIDSYTRTVLRQTAFTSAPTARVVLDLADGTMWVVDISSASDAVREFDLASLHQLRTVPMPGGVFDATVFNQRLYLATARGLFLVGPGSTAPTAIGSPLPAPAQALAVNTQAGTVLALIGGTAGHIVTIGDDGAAVTVGPTLNVTNPSIAVLNDTLWVGGVNPQARLLRMDPRTLRPLPESAGGVLISDGTDNDLHISAGVADLWVYNDTASQLLCVDSNSGRVLQRISDITGPVATGGSGPYGITSGTLVPLVLRGNCLG